MINKVILFGFSLSILLLSCKNNDNVKSNCAENEGAETLMYAGEAREYLVYVPDSYDGSEKVPLMLNFHGFGGLASDYIEYADMRPQSDANGFILVYPQGTCLDGFPHWNAALNGLDNKSDVDDLGFVEALIGELSANYSIDLERVYACGYSNGAFFSYALACYQSDLIAAIGSVSGTMLDTSISCAPNHPTAMINLHGTEDDVIPYAGGSDYISIASVLEYWIDFNNTNTTPITNTETDKGISIEHTQYLEGDNGVVVEHYKMVGGKHVWFEV
ncbi:MAG: PHB depolymerase family esterase, partial [Bacteroidota bacterium]